MGDIRTLEMMIADVLDANAEYRAVRASGRDVSDSHDMAVESFERLIKYLMLHYSVVPAPEECRSLVSSQTNLLAELRTMPPHLVALAVVTALLRKKIVVSFQQRHLLEFAQRYLHVVLPRRG